MPQSPVGQVNRCRHPLGQCRAAGELDKPYMTDSRFRAGPDQSCGEAGLRTETVQTLSNSSILMAFPRRIL